MSTPTLAGARGRFFVSPHAVRRYRERIRSDLTYEQALDELIDLTSSGRLVGPYTGQRLTQGGVRAAELWRGPRVGRQRERLPQSRLRFVVGHASGGQLPQVITVLPIGRTSRPS